MSHVATAGHGDRLADFTRDRRLVVLSLMAVGIGAMSAVVAWALIKLIAFFTNLAFHHQFSVAPAEPGTGPGLGLVIVPILGGLVIGLMARYGSEKIRGHGIPEALEAILFGRSRMDPKIAVLKPLSSAIAIGTGGPFGAEGPIIMTGGAFGSLFAQMFHLNSAERRTLLVAGAAGGMAAVFATPLAAVLLAVELLLFEWRPRSFVPVALAAAVANALRVPLLGHGPLFPVMPHAQLAPVALVAALVLGLACGFGSGLLTTLVYFFEDLFQRLPFHWMWWPALGGLAVGLGGLVDARAMGVGYGQIHELLTGSLAGGSLIRLLVVKALIWSIALGSGTSGGVLAPLLMMGGALGALLTPWMPIHDPGLWATLGMAAIMGGTMRSPLTAIAFALELTHDLNLLPALLVSAIAAHALTVLALRRSILTEKVARRGKHLMREYAVDPLTIARVSEVMDPDPQTLPTTTPVGELAERMARHDPRLTRRHAIILTDPQGLPVAMMTRGDVLRALAFDPPAEMPVIDLGSSEILTAYPDETLHDAALRMVNANIGRLAVITRGPSPTLVGYLGRPEVLAARFKHLEEEHRREPGWLDRLVERGAGGAGGIR